MPVVTGEVFAFPEGNLYLYVSASGATSGSGIGFAQGATLTFAYGWDERYCPDGTWNRVLTGRRADLSIGHLLSDRQTYNVANGTAAVNAKFEGLVTAGSLSKSALWTLYSGVVDSYSVTQTDGAAFNATLALHANDWTAIGG